MCNYQQCMSIIESIPFHDEPTQMHVNSHQQTEHSASLYKTTRLDSEFGETQNRTKTPSAFSLTTKKISGYTTKIQLPKDYHHQSLKQLLTSLCNQNYLQIQSFTNTQYLISRTGGNLCQTLLSCCFPFLRNQILITIEVITDSLNRKNYVLAKHLEGNQNYFIAFFRNLEAELRQESKNTSIDFKMMSVNKNQFNIKAPPVSNSIVANQISCYTLVKDAIQRSYSHKVTEFLEEIQVLSGDISNNTKKPSVLIDSLILSTNEVFEDIQGELTMFEKQLIYYSIEKYLSEHSHSIISSAYISFYSEKDQAFQTKKQLIYSKTPEECMVYLDIKPRYRLISSPSSLPYDSAISLLSQLGETISLRSGLFIIQSYYSEIKVNCYEFNHGKQQISTMDDILPVMIYTVLKSNVDNFYGVLQMISDYVKASGKFEIDMRVLTNLFVGLEYISKEWQTN